MMFVSDTNVVSELRKFRSGKADTNVMAWTDSVDAATRNVADFRPTGVTLINPWALSQ